MKIKKEQLKDLIQQIDVILEAIEKEEQKAKMLIDQVCPNYRRSAKNLIRYTAFRSHDLRELQKKLRDLGLSRLANADGHIKVSLLNTQYMLHRLLGKPIKTQAKSGLSIKNAKRLLATHTKELLGYRSKKRRVRIMVTQPTAAAERYEIVHDMIKNGMNCARINCAHDNPEVWGKIIANIKKASISLGRKVKITMDLAGPKIRTGPIQAGPKVRKFRPPKNAFGQITQPISILLSTEAAQPTNALHLPVSAEFLKALKRGTIIRLLDTRKKKRQLVVVDRRAEGVEVHCLKTTYIGTGTRLVLDQKPKIVARVGDLPPIEQSILLKTDDRLLVHRATQLGEPAKYDEAGQLKAMAHISCQAPEIFAHLKRGETVLFDDGKIEGRIESTKKDRFIVRITRARPQGSRLKAEKGMNFPTSKLGLSGLTQKDKVDLAFVAKHADVVNFSFVNSKADVEELIAELTKHKAINKLSIILKIETRQAFNQLPEILLSAMKVHFIGVMIARGDLAVETGWDHIGRIQEDILTICGAAHIPVVWATQVLENLAKTGLPSRSEITDAATALKAECVMLNKGPYINDAIRLLDTILSDMESYHEKNELMLPRMKK